MEGSAPPGSGSFGVALLAGGRAMRLPGKLALDAGGVPLVVRAFTNLARTGAREVYVSLQGAPADAIAAALDAPFVVDRTPDLGPLGGLLSTLPLMRAARVLAVAADAPFVDGAVAAALVAAWDGDTDACIPVHGDDDRLEPLAALYGRAAFLRAGWATLRAGERALHGVLARLRVRRVRFADARAFLNVNTPAGYAELSRAGGAVR
jgi:molybdopterin-guanine dinucleotide biosynthesis protein A